MRGNNWSILAVLYLFVGFGASAQPDSSVNSQQQALQHSLNLFYASLGKQSPLFNGHEYQYYDHRFTHGSAYFADAESFANGNIIYDGLQFNGVPMLYDLNIDGVVVLLYNHFTKIQLIKSKVSSFDYLGHHFININADTLGANTVIKSGFYDEIYNGKIKLLARRIKTIQTQNNIDASSLSKYFEARTEYYLKKGNVYYEVYSKRSFVGILKDKKRQLNQFIRAAQIDFNSDREAAMIKMASHYDQITN